MRTGRANFCGWRCTLMWGGQSRHDAGTGILIALRRTEELKNHVQIRLRNGFTVGEIQEALIQATAYAGFPAAHAASNAAADVVIMSKERSANSLPKAESSQQAPWTWRGFDLGVAVRAGAPEPDIRTVEAFRHLLLRSKSINALSTTGLYLTDKLLPNLGIAGEVTSKTIGGTLATVATGEVEIAIRPVSELVNVPGIDFVGPVPEEVQYLSIFSAAIVAGSHQVDAGQRLIHFLGSEPAEAAIRGSGMDPVKSR